MTDMRHWLKSGYLHTFLHSDKFFQSYLLQLEDRSILPAPSLHSTGICWAEVHRFPGDRLRVLCTHWPHKHSWCCGMKDMCHKGQRRCGCGTHSCYGILCLGLCTNTYLSHWVLCYIPHLKIFVRFYDCQLFLLLYNTICADWSERFSFICCNLMPNIYKSMNSQYFAG